MRYKLLAWDQDVGWQYDAACLGHFNTTGEDWFFRSEKGFSNRKKAKQLCSICPVKQQCLQYALDNDCSGIWGGTTDRERKRMRES